MPNNSIKKGLKVILELDIGLHSTAKTRVECYILKPEYDRITLQFPDEQSEFIPYLSEGTELKAFIYTYTGIVIVDSIVFDAPYEGQMVIEFNEDNKTIQRRKYLRMNYETELFIRGEEENIRVKTIDIGGGGTRFRTDEQFVDAQKLKASLRLSLIEPLVNLEGVILKKNFYKSNEYVLEFIKIEEDDRNRIIQKCLKLEKELNK